ncbi:S41 family peptidase [Xanthomonas translucens]|uniref:S41 family peptidase n=1 Tax=Xanthomonas campestris pv. translucens TaxID=343 RepID=UPI0018C79B57|nr:S41 family peptidase [Xanthomonas translucens]
MKGLDLLSFSNSGYMPVEARDGKAHRRLSVNIPRAATSVSFGFTFSGQGVGAASKIKVYRDEEVARGLRFDGNSNIKALVKAIKENALFESNVDWDSIAGSIKSASESSESYLNYPMYEKLIASLSDGHSSFLRPESARLAWGGTRPAALADVHMVGKFGYVRIPSISGRSMGEGDEFSREVSRKICALSTRPIGWMVDLRGNAGGSMWPMLMALSPLLGNERLGYFVNADGSQKPWKINGSLNCDLTAAPVALLVDRVTASSGELTAIAFLGRDDVRVFGQDTAGRTTANRPFRLPDGSILILTSAFSADRNGMRYERITPDVRVGLGAELRAAADWLSWRAPR